jgi:antitoxin ParD1/3/4
MTADRVTVSLDPELLADARAAVAAGEAESLSAYVADALRLKRDRARGLAELERILPGGRPPQEVLEQVRRDLGIAPR